MSLSPDLRAYIKELKPTCEYCKVHPTEEIHPSIIIHRLFKKCARLHSKDKPHDFIGKLRKYLKKRCSGDCICLRRKSKGDIK